MKTCIVTIIKNELDYLEEFIKYHIGIGIDHIFLFEDYGSLSHQDITSKYKDNVTVYSIDVVLNDHTRYTTQKYRNLAHGVYYNRALWFIKSNYDGIYDWCFATDIDEFITLRGIETTPENIRTYLSTYSDYDAIWLHWQNYNSNGHIYKPDYTKKGIQETYTQECGAFSRSSIWTNSKFVYNLNRYKSFFLQNQHRINWNCRYLDSDVLYLRHYILKSWEEFVWKTKIRGTFSVHHRPVDDFFELNPDLKPQKKKLIDIMHKMIENEK